jgi:hypothetical protein
MSTQTPKFKHLKAGDVVFVVEQQKRYSAALPPSSKEVIRVGNKFGYIKGHGDDRPFCLATGRSHHKENNMRANGYGFDVYLSEDEYRREVFEASELQRLSDRLIERHASRLVSLSAECVSKIHAVLDEETRGAA